MQVTSSGIIVDTGVAQESLAHGIMESPAHQRSALMFSKTSSFAVGCSCEYGTRGNVATAQRMNPTWNNSTLQDPSGFTDNTGATGGFTASPFVFPSGTLEGSLIYAPVSLIPPPTYAYLKWGAGHNVALTFTSYQVALPGTYTISLGANIAAVDGSSISCSFYIGSTLVSSFTSAGGFSALAGSGNVWTGSITMVITEQYQPIILTGTWDYGTDIATNGQGVLMQTTGYTP